jgi:PAS domain S-box-containing protein
LRSVKIAMEYSLFVVLAPLAAVVSLGAMVYIWRYRAAPGAVTLAALMLVVSGWLVTNTFELVADTESSTLLGAKLTYLFIPIAPVTWLAFALQYTHRSSWLARSRFALVCLIPLVTSVLAQTNEIHGLIWKSYTFVSINNLLAMRVTAYGPWFWLNAAYAYILVFLGAFLVVKEYFTSFKLYRQQSVWLVVGAVAPLVANIIYVFRLMPGFRKDYSSISFAFAGIAFALAIFRYRLFNLKPIARKALIDSMSDGMVVLDEQDRIVDVNPAALAMIGLSGDAIIGQPAAQVLRPWQVVFESFQDARDLHTDIVVEQVGTLRNYDLRIWPLTDRRGRVTGRLVVWRDITERRQLETEQVKLIVSLQEALTQVKTLSGLLPMCASCKKIRDDQGYWRQVEEYIATHTGAEFTHGICPECATKLYPQLYPDGRKQGAGDGSS